MTRMEWRWWKWDSRVVAVVSLVSCMASGVSLWAGLQAGKRNARERMFCQGDDVVAMPQALCQIDASGALIACQDGPVSVRRICRLVELEPQ